MSNSVMACGRTIRGVCRRLGVLILLCVLVAAPRATMAGPHKASLKIDVSGGYARLIFSANDDIDAAVRTAGNVLIISFKEPLDLSVDRLAAQAPDYIGAARRDPDQKAIRVALAQKVTVNSMAAGEKFFVDLLPETWIGVPPGLPQDVVEELARRAHEAERLVRQARLAQRQKKIVPVRVRVATQPSFTRYVFDIPDQTTVSADRSKERLALTFDAPLKFDLADADAALPRAIEGINAELDDDSSVVKFTFLAKVDLRTFRDEKSYVVDVVGADANPDEPSGAPAEPQQGGPPETTQPTKTQAEAAPKSIDELAAAMQKTIVKPPAAVAAQPPASPPQPAPPPQQPVASATPPPSAKTGAQPAQEASAQPGPAAQPPAPAADAVAPAPAADAVAPTKPVQQSNPPPAISLPASAVPPPAAAQMSAIAAPAAVKPPANQAEAEPPAVVPQPNALAPADDARVRAPPRKDTGGGKVVIELARQGANLKLSFPFPAPVAAAVFQRADTLWIVFDAKADIDLSALEGEASRTIRGAELTRAPDADIVRIKLDRPHLSSVATEGPVWTVEIGDSVLEPTHALDITRNLIGPNRASVTIPFERPHQLHRITDPEVGDQLLVVTRVRAGARVHQHPGLHRVSRARLDRRALWSSRWPTTSIWSSPPTRSWSAAPRA